MRIQRFLDQSPLFALYVSFDQIIGDFQDRLAAEDLHFVQALTLTGLFFEDRPVRPFELSSTLRVSRSNMSHTLRDLEKKGWVTRQTLSEDARAYCFVLTRSGKKKAPRLIQLFDSVQDQIEEAGGRGLTLELKRFVQIYKGCRIPG